MRSRYYNPIIKRFMNADVITGNVVDSGSMNRYAYVNGNPISYVDPFGLCADTDRVDSGLKKIVSGFIGYVVASAIAVGAIVSGGVLLGIIAVVAANVGFAAYSLSDMDEGNQDVIYGAAGADIKSRNFMLDTVFAGNKTAYTICLIALTVLDWAGGKMLTSPGGAGKTVPDINERENLFDDSSKILNKSIDEVAADSEIRLALPAPNKLLELPAPEERLALPLPGGTSEVDNVVWKNGWRTSDGKFASPAGPGKPGELAEQEVWDAIKQKDGWDVIEGHVSVRDATGQLRVYDGAAIGPSGKIIGLEVKSGSATKTAAQRSFDKLLNSSPYNKAYGVGKSKGIVIDRSIEIRK